MTMADCYDPRKHPHLATWRERAQLGIKDMRCPHCHQKGYKPYIHPDGQIVAEACGRCDHESSCGYHLTPTEWFKDNPTGDKHYNPAYVPPPPPPAIRIDSLLVQRYFCLRQGAGPNPLLRYWIQTFRNVADKYKEVANEYEARFLDTLKRFCVGTMGDGLTVWWITDQDGVVRSGKAMAYKADGHRDKTARQGFSWLHNAPEVKAANPENAEYVGCLFGLHQLTRHTREVHIVESEKTAVLMSVFKPSMTWMATMGLGNLNEFRLAPLIEKGVRIVCHPDYDGFDRWKEQVEKIRRSTPSAIIEVNDYIRKAWMLGDSTNADILDMMERDYKLLYQP